MHVMFVSSFKAKRETQRKICHLQQQKQTGKQYDRPVPVPLQHMTTTPSLHPHHPSAQLVFTAPVLWTSKRLATQPNPTGSDWTSSCSCINLSMCWSPVTTFESKRQLIKDRLWSVATGLFV